jgi:Tol biopolymer transport system component
MQLRTGYWVLAFVAVAGLIAADSTDSANVMMEAAHKKEVVDGDLNGAIKQYRAIVAKYAGNRAVSAMALVHIAECYQKMGDAESRKIYERVLREYGDQKEAAATAQARLGGSSVPNPSVLSKRLLCTECGDEEADFSPNGRLMVFTDWDSGDIAIRDMSTGQVKRLMAKTGTWKDSNAFGESPVFSPDLRQVLYDWSAGIQKGDRQLRVMQNEPGGKSRVLINPSPGEVAYYVPKAWFPDGKSVLISQTLKDRTRQLARVSVSDGAVKVLKSLEWRYFRAGRSQLSPDGQYIVYSAAAANPSKFPPAPTDPTDQHIYVLAANGSTETEIVKTSGANRSPVWTPDGKHILFTSDRSGKFDLWAIAVQNGKAAGAASLVSAEIGNVEPRGMYGGSYYYANSGAGAEYVNIAEFAPSGSNQTRIAHATESFVGVGASWSPDGKSIAFKRHHPGSADEYDVVVHSLETGDERTYLTNLGTSGNGAPAWFPDGKSIMTGIRGGGPAGVYRIDLGTGDFKLMGNPAAPSALSPDEKTSYVARNDEKDWDTLPMHIRAMDLSTGQEKEFFTMPEPGYAWFVLTPDRRTFVIRRQDQKTQAIHFYRLNIDGTGYREIYSIAIKDFPIRFNWTLTNDGRWILLAKRSKGDKNWQLLRIPIEGGTPESTGVELDENLLDRGVNLSPDGSRIAFTTVKRTEEMWALDNVVSVLK